MKKLIGLTLLGAAGIASAGPYHTINPDEASSGPDVSLSTFMAVQVQPWLFPPTSGPAIPPVSAMEFVPLEPDVYERGAYDPSTTNCFLGCNANLFSDYYAPEAGLTLMIAKFTTPIDYASVVLDQSIPYGGFVQAFNNENQLIAYCSGSFVSEGCFSASGNSLGLTLFSPDIYTLAIGAYYIGAQVDTISYGVPEPGTLGLLALGLAGAGFTRRRRAN
jgi:hypothetical protein